MANLVASSVTGKFVLNIPDRYTRYVQYKVEMSKSSTNVSEIDFIHAVTDCH